MKHLRLLASTLALAFFAITAKAAVGDTFTTNQLTYTVLTEDLDNSTGTVSVKSSNTEIEGLVTIPDNVQNGDFSYSVTSVPASAFANCSRMTDVHIGANVSSIAYQAFKSTPALTSIVIDNGNTIYNSINDCNAIIKTSNKELIAGCKNTVIPDGVKTIGQYAFSGCTNLVSITMPSTVTAVGNYAFYSCSNLSNLSLSDNITTFGQHAFNGCAKLESFTFPSKTKTIGAYTFRNTGLTEINIPNTITKLTYDYTFNSDKLKKVTVHRTTPLGINQTTFNTNGMLIVPDGAKPAYSNQQYWKNFNLIIEEDELNELNNIIEFEDANVKAICVANWDLDGDGELSTAEAAAVKSLGASISKSYFRDNNNITSFNELQYFTGLTTLNNYAFYGCKNLTSLKLPESITSIGNYAFYNCDGIINIVLPPNTQNIGTWAFGDCDKLIYIETEAITPPTTGSGTFSEYQQKKQILIVPDGTADLYRNANSWKNFGIIVEKSNVGQLNEYIVFEDENVKNICVQNYDINGDKEISIVEAANVKNISNTYFRNNRNITTFNELRYFTALTEIAANTFDGCTSLTSIQFPSSLESIGNYAFRNTKLATLEIPYNVNSIGAYAFYNCSSIQGKLTLPSNNTVVNTYAFNGCTGITELEIPEGVIKLRERAFQGCSQISSLVIPSTMEIFGRSCFENCTGLTSVLFKDSDNKDMLDKNDDGPTGIVRGCA